jgi:hypothetical protein
MTHAVTHTICFVLIAENLTYSAKSHEIYLPIDSSQLKKRTYSNQLQIDLFNLATNYWFDTALPQ